MTLDRKKLGQDIRDHRKACGKTIEKVVAEIGDDRISVKTCVRIEQGDPSVSKEKLGMVIHALGMDPFKYFTDEDIFYASLDDPALEKRLDAQKIMFPADSMCVSKYSIRNIPGLLVNLPIIGQAKLISLLQEIRCGFVGNEETVCDRLQEIYDMIPDSPEKRWAAHLCHQMRIENQNLLVSTQSKVRKQKLQSLSSSEESRYCEEKYHRMLVTYKHCLSDETAVSSYRLGLAEESVRSVEHLMKSLHCDEVQACGYLGKSVHSYREDRKLLETENNRDRAQTQCVNDPLHPVDVRWEGAVLCLDMPADLVQDLERIASGKYGISLEDIICCYLYWIVEHPDDFKEWISQWKK